MCGLRLRQALILAGIATAVAGGMTGCGGDGAPADAAAGSATAPPTDAPSAVVATIEEAALRPSPEHCTTLATERLIRVAYGGRAECERMTRTEPPADAVRVTGVRISGSRASARADFTGGSLGDQDVDVLLRSSGGRWRIDRYGLPTRLREEFVADFTRELRRLDVPAGERRCYIRTLEPTIRRIEATRDGDLDLDAFDRRTESVAARCLGASR